MAEDLRSETDVDRTADVSNCSAGAAALLVRSGSATESHNATSADSCAIDSHNGGAADSHNGSGGAVDCPVLPEDDILARELHRALVRGDRSLRRRTLLPPRG